MQLGIFAKTFAGRSLEVALDAVAASDVAAIQFNMALTGGSSLPAEIPDELSIWVRGCVQARGLQMAAVSGTYNMAHPDPGTREHGSRGLEAVIAAAPRLGTQVVTLCTGSRDPRDMWRWHPENGTASAWADMSRSIRAAVAAAVEHDVILGLEPEHNNVVADAATARRLLDEIASPHLKVVLDAANLIRPGELHLQAETMERAFELLGEDLALAHAKDVLDDGTVVPPGQGRLNYEWYVSLLRSVDYHGAVVLHGLAEQDVTDSLSFVRRHLDGESAERA